MKRLQRRSDLRLEPLEPRQLLTSAPVAVDDVYNIDEDEILALMPTEAQFVPAGSEWKYLDDGSDQGTAWRGLGLSDSSWSEGPAELGYGDGGEATVVDFGPNENNKFPTTYFRHKFFVEQPAEVSSLNIGVQFDDGVAVYLNGTEIARANLDDNAAFNTFAQATTNDETTFFPFLVDPSLLVAGQNVIAAEIHQGDAGSSDISFDLTMEGTVGAAGVLANDADADGDLLTASLVDPPAHGSVTISPLGSFSYLPAADYFGTDTFTYIASDGGLESDPATVTINVAGVNDAPRTGDDAFHTLVNIPLEVPPSRGSLQNDSDAEGSELTAAIGTDVTHGSLTFNVDGSFAYTPNTDYTGIDTFTYIASDGVASSEPTTVEISVTATNQLPISGDNSYTAVENTTLSIAAPSAPDPLVVFATDFDGVIPPEFSGVITTTGVQGFAGLGHNENVFAGSFLNNRANPDRPMVTELTLTNLPAHDTVDIDFLLALIANWDGAMSEFDGFLSPDIFNVSVDGETVFSTVFDTQFRNDNEYQPPEGAELAYSEQLGFFELDEFFVGLEAAYDMGLEPALSNIPHSASTLTISWFGSGAGYRVGNFFFRDDESWAIDNLTVSLRQGEPNGEAAFDEFGVLFDDTDPEGNALTASLASEPVTGTVVFHGDGTFEYTPAPDFEGVDSFTYVSNDGFDDSNIATVEITVTPGTNRAPSVTNKNYGVDEDGQLTIPANQGVLAGAADADQEPLQAVSGDGPENGTLNLLVDGSFVYTPRPDFFGVDTFTFFANDGLVNSPAGTATINVAGTPDAPDATADQYFIEPSSSLEVAVANGVLANDFEPDGQAMTVSLVSDVSNGNLDLDANGSFTYTPNANYRGTDRFTYQSTDGALSSQTVAVDLIVDAAPRATVDDYSIAEDHPLITSALTGVLANDKDDENDDLTAILIDEPDNGDLELALDGSFTYHPDEHFFGGDSFSYLANDGDQDSNIVVVSLTITAENDPPMPTDDEYGVAQNGVLVVDATSGLLSNDVDVDSASLTVTIVDDVMHGELSWNADGSFEYTPTADFVGEDTFTYTASDGLATSTNTNVSIFVADPAASIVINEVMYHPRSENDAEEYIELYNLANGAIDLTGWRISRGVDFVFPESSIEGGGYLVIAADVDAFAGAYPSAEGSVIGGWTGRLSNGSEEIEIRDAGGGRIDRVTYADEGDWAVRRIQPDPRRGLDSWEWVALHDGEGRSLELVNPNVSNRRGQNWDASLASGGTPGAANSVYAESIAPMIWDVSHSPLVPTQSDTVNVVARLVDVEGTVFSAEVMHRVSADVPGNYAAVEMFDDGLHGDGAAGDGVFGATLPRRRNRSIVEFYVQASDEDGNTRTWPAPTDEDGGQDANLLYQVDNTTYDGDQPVYRVILTSQEMTRLTNIDRQSDAQMNATFVNVDGTGGEVRYNAGIRIRGSGSRGRPVPNYRVNLPSDQPWQDVDAINLNSQYTYSQLLGMTVFAQAGILEEEATAVQLHLNGISAATQQAVQQGSYVRLEVTNGDFVDNHLPNDPTTNIYRGQNARLEYLGENGNAYAGQYDKQTNASQNEWSDVIALTRALDRNQTPNDVFVEELDKVADVDQWMRFLAVNALFVNEENGLINGNGDDFSQACGVVDSRCQLFPHDLDTLLAEGDNSADTARIDRDIFEPRPLQAFDRILDVPRYLDLYYFHLRDLATTIFSAEQMNATLDNLLGSWVDPAVIDDMKAFAAGRVEYVLQQIPENLPNLPAVAIVDGEPPAITPLNSASLVVSGEGVTHYRASVNDALFGPETPVATPFALTDLADGAYSVQFIGRNAAGEWQNMSQATHARPWTVDNGYSKLIINEVIASNVSAFDHEGTTPDAIELYNTGSSTIALEGLTITDDPAVPDKFTFPAGSTIAPNDYLILHANDPDGTSGIHLGFSLDNDGEGVFLYESGDTEPVPLDNVEFGTQITDYSIGRDADFEWQLNVPSLGSANTVQPTGNASLLKVNEWLAAADRFSSDDFIELYNPASLPVSLGGLFFTDNLAGDPADHEIAPLSFMEGNSYAVFFADNDERDGANHLGFRLDPNHDSIALLDKHLGVIDSVFLTPQSTDISQGLNPDGSRAYAFFSLPTPGLSNVDDPVAGGLMNGLRITEVMYHPVSDTNNEEFIELQNVSDFALDLTGVRIRDGVDFTFPSMMLQPGEIVVVANTIAGFEAAYGPNVNVAGEFSGNLSNGGEVIELKLPLPLEIDIQRFRYDDDADEAWPVAADGQGPSLVVIDTDADYGSSSNWQASIAVGGTPGVAGLTMPGDFDEDGLLGCTDSAQLNAEILAGNHDNEFDLTGDGLVDVDDMNDWVLNRRRTVFGDANLDGVVDGSDFNIWNDHKFTAGNSWCNGDFNADGITDGSDFNTWSSNRFTAAAADRVHARTPKAAAAEDLAVGRAVAFQDRDMPVLPTFTWRNNSGQQHDLSNDESAPANEATFMTRSRPRAAQMARRSAQSDKTQDVDDVFAALIDWLS